MDERTLRDDQQRQRIADFARLFAELVQPVERFGSLPSHRAVTSDEQGVEPNPPGSGAE